MTREPGEYAGFSMLGTILKRCSFTGCRALVPSGVRFCSTHRKTTARGYGYAHQKDRARVMAEHGWRCFYCGQAVMLSDDVAHLGTTRTMGTATPACPRIAPATTRTPPTSGSLRNYVDDRDGGCWGGSFELDPASFSRNSLLTTPKLRRERNHPCAAAPPSFVGGDHTGLLASEQGRPGARTRTIASRAFARGGIGLGWRLAPCDAR